MRGRQSRGPRTEAPPGKWEQHGASLGEPWLPEPCWSGIEARLYKAGFCLAASTPTLQSYLRPVKHLLWQGTSGQTWSSKPSRV